MSGNGSEPRRRAAALAIRGVLFVAGLEAVLTLAAVSVVAGFGELSDSGWNLLEQAIDFLAPLEVAAFLVAAVTFVRWQNETLRSTKALGGELLYGVRVAAASWFIPVMSFFVPFLSLRRAAGTGRGPDDADARALVDLWWGLCVLWFLLWSASSLLSLWVDETRLWIAVSAVNTASTATLFVTGFVALSLLRALTHQQEAARRRLGGTSPESAAR